MRSFGMFRHSIVILILLTSAPALADTYSIDGEFDGCEFGRLYPLLGGGILECQDFEFFYTYSPRVVADGRRVILIDDKEVDAYLHDGSVIETRISDTFEGCDFDKRYALDNGLIFVCATYSYSYSYRPQVRIFLVEGMRPRVFIRDKEYRGSVYRGG
ncbi:MAG TPA: hypothetical protein VMF90_17570 [Rhizobiaceae bacterium]|nr:hypothetical protein [Rhizobiaceae bacterium]